MTVCLLGASALFVAGSSTAATILVDINDDEPTTADTSSDVYNVVALPAGTNTTRATSTTGLTVTNLNDSAGNATGVNFFINTYNTDDNARASGDAFGAASGLTHDSAPAGIEPSAAFDSFWMNNQDSTTGTFGWIITFSGLTGAAYDLSVLSGSTTTVGSWSVTTGTGDTDIEAYGINSGTNIYSDVQSFTNVAPVAGVITLTSTADANEFTFRNAYIAAATITLVPEPGSLALLGLGALCVLRRRGA